MESTAGGGVTRDPKGPQGCSTASMKLRSGAVRRRARPLLCKSLPLPGPRTGLGLWSLLPGHGDPVAKKKSVGQAPGGLCTHSADRRLGHRQPLCPTGWPQIGCTFVFILGVQRMNPRASCQLSAVQPLSYTPAPLALILTQGLDKAPGYPPWAATRNPPGSAS